jgi:mannose-6-phosphate isomerase-like protein (cupin superfamily)
VKRGAAFAWRDALARLPTAAGERFASVFERRSLSLELYAPRDHDAQQPHARDEVYVAIRGTGVLTCSGERLPFAAGDALFVPAGVVHRFEDFSDDLALWVMFYGREGGEAD